MAPLLQFKAGKAFRRNDTNWVDPVPGRGLIYIQEEDGLMHFYYKDLESNAVDDLIIFPGDATFSKATDRVHVLKFNSSSSRHFFWHQDVDPSQDDERARKVNELIGGLDEEEEEEHGEEGEEGHPSGDAERSGGDMDVEGVSHSIIPSSQSIPSSSPNVSNQAPIPARAGSSSGTIPSAPSKLGTQAQMDQLRNILAGISGASGGSQLGSGVGMGEGHLPEYLLTGVLPNSILTPLISEETTKAALLPFLPSDLPPNQESLHRAITSPEFKRSVSSLDRALRTGALGPLVVGLGLGEESAMGLDAFLEGIQKQAERELAKEKETKQDGESEGKDDVTMNTE